MPVSYTHLLALSRIADNGIFLETKDAYGKDVVTGFMRLNGATVGAVANRSEIYDEEGNKAEEFDGSLSARGARKAAEFVKFCDAFEIPVQMCIRDRLYAGSVI